MFLRICFCAILLNFSCNASKLSNNNINKRITVVGTALEDKGGATVITDTPQRRKYFIDGLDEWNKKYYGKKVKVTGILVIEKWEDLSTDSVLIQGYIGNVATLMKPKWGLVK